MNTISVELYFRFCYKIKDAVKELNILGDKIEKSGKEVYYDLKLYFSKFTEPEILAVISAYIRNWRFNGILFKSIIIDPQTTYMDRCGFSNSLIPKRALNYFIGRSSNLKELTAIGIRDHIEQGISAVNDIIHIVKEKYLVEQSIYSALNFCLWEVIDNIYNHAEEKYEYNVILQNFTQKRVLTIAVVDCGIGIYNALVQTQGSEFSQITEKQSLFKCVEKNVTNGKGKGNGLYFTNKFIENNGGELLIYSGKYCLWNKQKETKVISVPYWKGTIVVFKIRTDVAVDALEVFDGNIPISVEECEEQIGGLW